MTKRTVKPRQTSSVRFIQTPANFNRPVFRSCLSAEQLEHRLTLDGSDPLGAVLQGPNSNNQIAIVFSRPVTGVDLSDFAFTLQDQPLELSTAQLESLSGQDYLLTLPELLNDGDYDLQLLAENSGIADEADPQILLVDDALVEWTRDTLAPSLAFEWSLPTIMQPTQLRVAALGDSQTTEAGNSYVPYLRQQLSSDEATVDIFAEPGWQVPQVQGLWDSHVKDAGYDVAIFFAGVNDLVSTNRTAEEIFAPLATMFDEALARDMTVIAVGVSPWSHYEASTTNKQLQTQQLNALIAQYATAHSNQVRFVDSSTELGSALDPQRLAIRHDSGDGLHLSSAGDQLLAARISTAIQALSPNVSQSASVTVRVSEPVTGLNESNFRLLRGDVAQSVIVSTLSPLELQFDFQVLANDAAVYTLEWIGPEPIADLYGNLLAGETIGSTLIDRQAPTAELTLIRPAVSHESVGLVNIQFSEPVTGLSVSDFQFMANRQPLDISSATLSELAPNSYQLDLSGIAELDGTYRLVLTSGDSEIGDLNGNSFRTPVIVDWVQLAAEPSVVDGLLTIVTTSQSETVELNIVDRILEIWINGLKRELPLDDVQQIQLEPLSGRDIVSIEMVDAPELPPVSPWLTFNLIDTSGSSQLSLFGIAGDDAFESTPAGVSLSNTQFTIDATGFLAVNVYGASTPDAMGNDTATFTDSSETERFIGRPTVSGWTAPTYEHWVQDFESVVASSSGGGDTATLYDSVGDDVYAGTSTQGQLSGLGYNLQVQTFPVVTVSTSNGNDTATLTGSASVDTFVAQSRSSAFYGGGFRHNLNNFASTLADGNGGNDVATLYDSTGTDSAELWPFNGRMTGTGFSNVATQFQRVNAYSRFGSDAVTMTGSSGSDTYTGQETSSSLVGAGFGLYAYRFASTTAVGNGGSDTAKLYDSTGNDRLDATPSSGTLTAPTYSLTAEQFPILYAYARSGTDTAFLNGTSANETYTSYATYGVFASSGRTQYAYGFDRVTASGGGGTDVANLYDSNDNDTLISSLGQAEWTGPGFQHVALGFPRTNTYSRAGYDTAELNGSTGNDTFNGQIAASFVTGSGLSNYAYGFDRVTSQGLGGTDTANIYDSTGDDVLVATSQSVTLQSGSFSNTARAYARSNVYSRSGYDTATLVGTPQVETFSGQTTSSSMIGVGIANYAYAFDAVVAESGGGADIASLYDSTGDDMLIATSTSATLSGSGYRYTANAFSRVNAYSRSGNDMAMLIGSTRSETVVVRPEYSYIKTTSYLNYASGFDTVSITGGGGNDSAYLYDSVGNDQLMIGNRTAMLMSSSLMASLEGFYRINAYASTGYDRVVLSDTTGNDTYTGRNNLGTLSSSGFTANLESFDTVVLAPAIGGTNTLDIADLAYILEVGLGWQ